MSVILYYGHINNGRYEFKGPVPDGTDCASCGFNITRSDEQKRLHALTDCKCYAAPYVCSTCRHRNDGNTVLPTLKCKWCQGLGVPKTFIKNRNESAMAKGFGRFWFQTRVKYQHVQCQFLQRILQNWNIFLHYRQFVTNCFDLPIINIKVLKRIMFKSWFEAQLFQKRGKILVNYSKTQLNVRFLRMLKNVTFARLFIRNLFGGCSHTHRMMAAIHRRMLSNIKTLFEISLEL